MENFWEENLKISIICFSISLVITTFYFILVDIFSVPEKELITFIFYCNLITSIVILVIDIFFYKLDER